MKGWPGLSPVCQDTLTRLTVSIVTNLFRYLLQIVPINHICMKLFCH